ncbi:uncharacterized protein CLUP02_16435 [Colletotrichum lupini]|uniref:Uncharacterized protein n=1 Tax=Colletotrichum lupini TaxID=145971 RepID=A0A9Q8T8L3_9PEZI|nr:uncharacterized protein CLUP02_16435 [Colletotrichum lupini]UQC90903.1 hypothetical protein CLUP02_16435 [Colletotrichum lupini]
MANGQITAHIFHLVFWGPWGFLKLQEQLHSVTPSLRHSVPVPTLQGGGCCTIRVGGTRAEHGAPPLTTAILQLTRRFLPRPALVAQTYIPSCVDLETGVKCPRPELDDDQGLFGPSSQLQPPLQPASHARASNAHSPPSYAAPQYFLHLHGADRSQMSSRKQPGCTQLHNQQHLRRPAALSGRGINLRRNIYQGTTINSIIPHPRIRKLLRYAAHHQVIISLPLFGTIKDRSSNDDTNHGLSCAAPNHRRSAVALQGPFNPSRPCHVTLSPLGLFVTVSIDSNLHAAGLDDVSSLRHASKGPCQSLNLKCALYCYVTAPISKPASKNLDTLIKDLTTHHSSNKPKSRSGGPWTSLSSWAREKPTHHHDRISSWPNPQHVFYGHLTAASKDTFNRHPLPVKRRNATSAHLPKKAPKGSRALPSSDVFRQMTLKLDNLIDSSSRLLLRETPTNPCMSRLPTASPQQSASHKPSRETHPSWFHDASPASLSLAFPVAVGSDQWRILPGEDIPEVCISVRGHDGTVTHLHVRNGSIACETALMIYLYLILVVSPRSSRPAAFIDSTFFTCFEPKSPITPRRRKRKVAVVLSLEVYRFPYKVFSKQKCCIDRLKEDVTPGCLQAPDEATAANWTSFTALPKSTKAEPNRSTATFETACSCIAGPLQRRVWLWVLIDGFPPSALHFPTSYCQKVAARRSRTDGNSLGYGCWTVFPTTQSSRFRHTRPVVLTGLARVLRILKYYEGLLVDLRSFRRRSSAWETHVKPSHRYKPQLSIERHSVRRALKEYREPLSSGGLRSGMYQSFPRAAASEAVVSAQERRIKSRASPPGPGPPPSVVSGAGGERTPMRCQQLEDLGL